MNKNEYTIVNNKFINDILITLNNIPNHKNVGPNGESSYEMADKLTNIIKE